MSGIALAVSVTRETPALDAQARAMGNPRALNAALGKRGEVELKAHFLRREGEPNSQGWPKQHFWSRRIRNSTKLTEISDAYAIVTIADPAMAMKVHGGTIRPKGHPYLAIPARAESYGKSPRLFSNLRFIFGRTGGALVAFTPGERRKKGEKRLAGEGLVYYWLVKEVTQVPDRRALPPVAEFRAALQDEANRFFQRRRAQ